MLDTGYSTYTNCRSAMYSLGIEGMNFNIIKTIYIKRSELTLNSMVKDQKLFISVQEQEEDAQSPFKIVM